MFYHLGIFGLIYGRNTNFAQPTTSLTNINANQLFCFNFLRIHFGSSKFDKKPVLDRGNTIILILIRPGFSGENPNGDKSP